MTRLLPLLLSCSVDVPPINGALDGDGCGRTAVAEYTAHDGCVKLQDTNGKTLFKLDTSDSCGGPPCIVLLPGETGFALELVKLDGRGQWTVEPVSCDAQCCGEYLGRFQCW